MGSFNRTLIYPFSVSLALFLVIFSAVEWGELKTVTQSTGAALRERNIRIATLSERLIRERAIDITAQYPLYDFAERQGLKQILAVSPDGTVLNDTANPRPVTPQWLKEDSAVVRESIESGNAFTQGFSKDGASYQAVLVPFINGAGPDKKSAALAFVFDGPAVDADVQPFLFFLLGSSLLFAMGYVLFRGYSKEKKQPERENPTEVGFVVDTFHGLVSRLKENERELETLRAMAEDRANRIEDLSRNILESVPSGVISLDGDYRITMANSRAEKILEFSREDAVGKKPGDVFRGRIVGLLEKSTTLERGEILYETASGKKLWLGFSITPLLD
ncbi:MAG: PAS domain-containing protein, partial [Nitrospiraceae bacterium]|nr:PAS domain-containing protein [Nitrospiraceae bacterium]